MTKLNSKSSKNRSAENQSKGFSVIEEAKGLPEVDSCISFEETVSKWGIQQLYEFVETLEYPDTPIVITFHISARAELEDDDDYRDYPAPKERVVPPQTVSHIAFQLGKLLAQRQAGLRVQDFFIDNTEDRYTVKIILRPIGLPDLVNIGRK